MSVTFLTWMRVYINHFFSVLTPLPISGLTKRVLQSKLSEEEAEEKVIEQCFSQNLICMYMNVSCCIRVKNMCASFGFFI